MRSYITLVAGAVMLTSACAGNSNLPTFGDEIRSSGFGSLGSDWESADKRTREAQRSIREGGERVEKGEKLVRAGREDLQRGEALIDRGGQEQRDAERALARARADRERIEARYRTVSDTQLVPPGNDQ